MSTNLINSPQLAAILVRYKEYRELLQAVTLMEGEKTTQLRVSLMNYLGDPLTLPFSPYKGGANRMHEALLLELKNDLFDMQTELADLGFDVSGVEADSPSLEHIGVTWRHAEMEKLIRAQQGLEVKDDE